MSERHHLQLITDRRAKRGVRPAVASALSGGIGSVQVRDKGAPAADVWASVLEIAPLARARHARVLVNDRIDVALAAAADGVHLAARSLPAAQARPLLAPWQILGVSVHSVDDAVRAAKEGADYVTFGHVFPTWSHEDVPARGVSALGDVVDAVDIPVLAIGGITAQLVADVLATGCAGIAVISAILGADDPAGAARALRAALDAVPDAPRRPFPEWRQQTCSSS